MKKIVLLLFGFIAAIAGKAQENIPYTELNYNVHYHWGFINVMIGHGVVTMQSEGGQLSATLDGNTIPWNGRVFCISDTLKASMSPDSETISYINGWYRKPKVSEFRSSSYNPDLAANFKNIKGQGTLNADANTMEAVTVTSNMLGMFYYFKQIDFESMSPGQQITIPIQQPGAVPERVVVTYNGKSHFNAGEASYSTYAVHFEYSYHGSMSGYSVAAEVSADERIPVSISASLPIGKVEMIYHQ